MESIHEANENRYTLQIIRCCTTILFDTTSVSCEALCSIKLVARRTEQLACLLRLSPDLADLVNVTFVGLYFCKISFDFKTTLEWLDLLLLCTPNVANFDLRVSRWYDAFSFANLHTIMSKPLPMLKQRRFHCRYYCLRKPFDLYKPINIGPLFKTVMTDVEKQPVFSLRVTGANRKKKYDVFGRDVDFDDDD